MIPTKRWWVCFLLPMALVVGACNGDPMQPDPPDPDPPDDDPPAAVWSSPVQLFERHGRIASGGGESLFAIGQNGSTSSAFGAIRSEDQGESWGTAGEISGASNHNVYRGFRAEGNVLHLVSRDSGDDHLYYHRSNDGGSSWEPRVQITTSGADATQFRRYALAVAGNRVYLVDSPSTVQEIPVWISQDGGISWDRTTVESGPPLKAPSVPSIAVDGSGAQDVVHVVWKEDGENLDFPSSGLDERRVYYRRSRDGGATWDAVVQLTDDDDGRILRARPDVVVAGDRVYVIWEAHGSLNTNVNVWFSRSEDAGSTWSQPVQITDSPGNDSWNHALFALGPGPLDLHVAVMDDSEQVLRYLGSRDGGATWTQPEEVLTAADDGVQQPFGMAVTPGYLHLLAGAAGVGDGPQPTVYVRRSLP